MSALHSRAVSGNEPHVTAPNWLSRTPPPHVWLFGGTTLLSAALLLSIQPLFARLILPQLGGTPATWNTCLVFFQTVLLAGYFYVHALSVRLPHRRQVLVHALLLGIALAFLPIAQPDANTTAPATPVWWLLLTLASSVGLPFFMLSTTAPLLQRWYALRTEADPYFLYATSNTGSLVGLLSYPFVIEPLLTLDTQRTLWSVLLVGTAILIAACGLISLRLGLPAIDYDARAGRIEVASRRVQPIAGYERLRWLVLAFVPSSLLLGVMLHISTDVAAVPLLWVVPLSLYLLTFIVAFASRAPASRLWINRLAPLAIVSALGALVFNPSWLVGLAIHLGAFTVVALACHRELSERRPAAEHLTTFYLWLSLGGALGGLFNALVAPLVFTQVVEYPLVLALAALVRPSPTWRRDTESLLLLVALPLFVFGIVVMAWLMGFMPQLSGASLVTTFWLCAALSLAFSNRRTPLAMAIAAVVLAHTLLPRQEGTRVLFSARSFYGVHRVTMGTDPAVTRLFHGTTLHGWQAAETRDRCEPTSYYHRVGPIGQVFAALGDRLRDVAVIGLGAGSLACYGREDTTFTFYEIDPAVERIARDPSLFTYLSNARGSLRVSIGDGRVSLTAAPPRSYDLIVVDAFSSDAIPTHLLTREFLKLAKDRLRPDGLLAFHISNRHLDLGPVLSATASSEGLRAFDQYHSPALADASASRWMLIGPGDGLLTQAASGERWRSVAAAVRGWTDDFSNILDVLVWSRGVATGIR